MSIYVNLYIKLYAQTIRDKIWECNINTKEVNAVFAKSFWKDVLLTWRKYVEKCKIPPAPVRKQILWYNSNIRVAKSSNKAD